MASSDNVILSFSAFDLETGTDCRYDYLEVRSATRCFWGGGGVRGGGSVSVCACLSSLGDMSVCVSVCLFIVFEVHKVTVTFLF